MRFFVRGLFCYFVRFSRNNAFSCNLIVLIVNELRSFDKIVVKIFASV